MRYFLDTEFIDDGHSIDLISIGLVCADGREYYAESADCDHLRASEWVEKHVLPHLEWGAARKTRATIKADIEAFIGTTKPEIWAWYGSYDFVAFIQLWGSMMSLPPGYPRFVRDIKHMADVLGDPPLPAQTTAKHHALLDARWTMQAFSALDRWRMQTQAGVML